MKDETIALNERMVATIENELGEEIRVTGIDITEYVRGDPTSSDATVTGAEIEINGHISYEDVDDDQNDYRVK